MRQCRCAREEGCRRCLLGYHHAVCAADSREARARRALKRFVARKQARRHPERGK